MKNTKILKSIKAISDGLAGGGCEYATNFPGFNSHIIFNSLGYSDISLNEKIAYQEAFGGSMAGKRSVVLFKGTGLNVALDEYLHSVLNGINAGLVVILTDDLEGESSPEIQDSRPIIDMYGGLWFEPYSNQNAYDVCKSAFEISEELDVPIVIRLTNNYFRNVDDYQRNKLQKNKTNSKLDTRRSKYISHWKPRYEKLQKKNKKIQLFCNNLYKINNKFETIIVGSSTPEINKTKNNVRIYTYPLPVSILKTNKNISVFENGDSYVYSKLHVNADNKLVNKLQNKITPNTKQWKKWEGDEKLFKALQRIKPSYVVADEGVYTDESTNTNNICLCMGSAVGIAIGMAENGTEYPFCISGDTAYSFGNVHSLFEAKSKNNKFCLIVINNGGAISTGGQKVAYDFSNLKICKTITLDYNRTSIKVFMNTLNEIRKSNKLTVLYINK